MRGFCCWFGHTRRGTDHPTFGPWRVPLHRRQRAVRRVGLGRGIAWKTIGQSLEFHANKKIDKIQIETIHTTQQETITQIENYYFDITECFGHPPAFMDKNKNEDKLGELIQYSKINERICPQP